MREPQRERMQVTRNASLAATRGPADNFTGSVVVSPLFGATEGRPISGAYVTFEPCARSAWHTHPAGQTLIVTAGKGWIQEWGGDKQEIGPGDVIWTPPGVKHWHGATVSSAMTHLAMQQVVDGRTVDWLEQVDDTDYRK